MFSDAILRFPLSVSLVLSVVIFVHEFGHYIVAKICKVKVESFSIGFGPEIFGFNDKSGTRWRLSAVPLGGYVKMLGDINEASVSSSQANLTDEERLYAFATKPRYKKAAIVFAGPFANILFSIIIFMAINMCGYYYVPPIIQNVIEGSLAEKAGLLPGDTIVKIHGHKIKSFEDVKRMMLFYTHKEDVEIEYARNNKEYKVTVKIQNKNLERNLAKIPIIGVVSGKGELRSASFFESIGKAINDIYDIMSLSFRAMIEMITRERSTCEIAGPVRIAKESFEAVKIGTLVTLKFIAFISTEIAIMNLLPIPLLDGGHLFQYIIEAVIRRDMSLQYQKYAAAIGTSILLLLITIGLWNDLKHFIS